MEFVIEPRRRDRKRQEVHERLLQAASALFHERGVERTTVDDIAQAADVARQTLFNHFGYKEALAVELAARGIQATGARAHALLEAGVPALEVLQRAAEWVLEAALEEGEVTVVMARELMHHNLDRATRAERCVPLSAIFEAILRQAREEGTIRSDLPLSLMATQLSSVLRLIWLKARYMPADELRREMAISFDIMFNGITE